MSNLQIDVGRSTVYTNGGMVCSVSPLAASVGVGVLRDGGNAFDAAIATAAAECVTVPAMCGLGGESFAIMYEARTGKVFGLSSSGQAPMSATREYFRSLGYNTMPLTGPLSAAIPGEVDSYITILEKFGTRSLRKLIEPAIGLAEEGYPVPPVQSVNFRQEIDKLNCYTQTADLFTRNGKPYQEGDILRQRDLATTLKRVAEGGSEEFYQGETARKIVQSLSDNGGLYTLDEFSKHQTFLYEEPIATTYRGNTIYETSLPSQGFLVLEILNIIEGFDLAKMGFYNADTIHLLVEAKKLAFADRNKYMGDPNFVNTPLRELLSKEFANERRKLIREDRVNASITAGPLHNPIEIPEGDTSYLCVIDKEGNSLSFIHSLSNAFGSGFVADGTGVLLNNRIGRGFSLEKGHPNVIEPAKHTMHTLNAYMVFRENKPYIIGGTPGGDSQIAWNVQVITNLLDHDMDAQQAVEAPRWTSLPGSDPVTLTDPQTLQIHEATSKKEIQRLRSKGHSVTLSPPRPSSGSAKVIVIDTETGVRMGGSDPRSDGHVAVD